MASRQQPFDYLLKLIIIGDSGVGKTCLLLRFSEENFQNSHITTIGKKNLNYAKEKNINHDLYIGIDFKIRTINLDGKNVKVQIWDTAGQERFRTITQTYYRGAQGVILAYDSTSTESFENVTNWIRQVDTHASPNVKKILLGNKCDLTDQKVISSEQGAEIAKANNMQFFETSAKSGIGITEAFESISREIIKGMESNKKVSNDQRDPKNRVDSVTIKSDKPKDKKKCCK